MSKELTEQWRNGTLEENMYYVKLPEEIIIANLYQLKQLALVNDADEIEVLAPVPSYDEYKVLVSNSAEFVQKMHILEKKLDIATKALKDIKEHTKELSLPSYTGMRCYKALKEIEGE